MPDGDGGMLGERGTVLREGVEHDAEAGRVVGDGQFALVLDVEEGGGRALRRRGHDRVVARPRS